MALDSRKVIAYIENWENSFYKLYRWNTYVQFLSKSLKKHEVNALRLLAVETPIELAVLLRSTFEKIQFHINSPTYNEFFLKKKRGGKREISEPAYALKRIQNQLNKYLQAYYLCIKPEFIHGFVINPNYKASICNIAQNAKPHVGKKHLLNMDIQNFFPTISATRVRNLFSSSYFRNNIHMATALALLTTYKGKLPVGAPTSPVISNFVCIDMDTELFEYCKKNNITFTRYADDMSFSSDSPFNNVIIDALKSIIEKHGFQENPMKTRLSGANRKQTVTGLVVNQKVNVDRKFIRKVRAMMYDCKRNGLLLAAITHFGVPQRINEKQLNEKFRLRLLGYIDFIGQVRGKKDSLYLKFLNDFIALPKK